MPTSLFLAQEMGTRLGKRDLLFQEMPKTKHTATKHKKTAITTVRRFLVLKKIRLHSKF